MRTPSMSELAGAAAEKITNRKWCSNCQAHKNTAGGVYIPINKGKQKRWKCEACKLP